MKNHKGIVWAPILIIIATIVVTGVAGFFLFEAGNTNDNENSNVNVSVVNRTISNRNNGTNSVANTNNASSNQNTNIGNNGSSYFQISEWGVEFLAPRGVTLKYIIDSNGFARFTTAAISSHDYCGADQAPVGIISRSSALITDGPLSNQTPITIDSWYYYFTSPQATCSSNEEIANQQTAATNLLRPNFSSLRAVVANPTAGWKTYTNDQYAFLFKYPSNWSVREYQYSQDNPLSSFSVLASDNLNNPKQAFQVCPENRGTDCTPFQDGQYTNQDATVTVDGKTATRRNYTLTGLTNKSISVINFTTTPTGWQGVRDFAYNRDIRLSGDTNNSFETVDLILSTFAFTN